MKISNDLCLICLDDLNNKIIKPTYCNCNILLHKICYEMLCKNGLSCPICRLKIENIIIQNNNIVINRIIIPPIFYLFNNYSDFIILIILLISLLLLFLIFLFIIINFIKIITFYFI